MWFWPNKKTSGISEKHENEITSILENTNTHPQIILFIFYLIKKRMRDQIIIINLSVLTVGLFLVDLYFSLKPFFN